METYTTDRNLDRKEKAAAVRHALMASEEAKKEVEALRVALRSAPDSLRIARALRNSVDESWDLHEALLRAQRVFDASG